MTVGQMRKLLADPDLPAGTKILVGVSKVDLLSFRRYWRVRTRQGDHYWRTCHDGLHRPISKRDSAGVATYQ